MFLGWKNNLESEGDRQEFHNPVYLRINYSVRHQEGYVILEERFGDEE
jgi:hypothetical protein